ncbi:type II toxin-antitoxin system RelE/ParE family toxin [Haloferula sargassicola]|uniref:Type II toxin-antitoxin system RelE/ParE family toxin n=1 Tax=Haloferula sargassicola TaxID=490096 RepID=A0ABP9USB9_9BACT
MTYRFLSPALLELTEAAQFYHQEVEGLGAEFLEEVDAAISRILQFPEAWSPLKDDFRRCSLRRFPYVIIYTIRDEGEILIISLFHQSREPRSWRRNL